MMLLRAVKRRRVIGTVAVLFALCGPGGVLAQSAAPRASPTGLYPELRKDREILLLAAGTGLLISGRLVPVSTRDIPFGGLDPAEIAWGSDRAVVGNRDVRANGVSDWTRAAAMALPLALAFTAAQPGERWHGLAVHGVVYAETMLFSQGSTLLAKTTGSRPRPYAYLPEDQRPNDPAYDVSQERTFRSMPSGHSSSAWTGAALGVTEHLLSRPDASWVERVGVGFVGAGFAGATSTLRVTAGQHFRSDVLAGAAIGVATGVSVPLLHRGARPLPSRHAWLQSMGGALAGTAFGILVAR